MPRAPLLPDRKPGSTGRPRKEPPTDAPQRIETLAAAGHFMRGVAQGCGVNVEVLNRWMQETPALRDAFEQGREKERHVLHNTLYRAATEGTGKDALIAAMFLLKARHGYREGEPMADGTSRVNITFNLPGASKPEHYVEVVNAKPE